MFEDVEIGQYPTLSLRPFPTWILGLCGADTIRYYTILGRVRGTDVGEHLNQQYMALNPQRIRIPLPKTWKSLLRTKESIPVDPMVWLREMPTVATREEHGANLPGIFMNVTEVSESDTSKLASPFTLSKGTYKYTFGIPNMQNLQGNGWSLYLADFEVEQDTTSNKKLKVQNRNDVYFMIRYRIKICCPYDKIGNIFVLELEFTSIEDIKIISKEYLGADIRYTLKDDTAILVENTEDLRADLNTISTVGKEYNLSINVTKTKLMIIEPLKNHAKNLCGKNQGEEEIVNNIHSFVTSQIDVISQMPPLYLENLKKGCGPENVADVRQLAFDRVLTELGKEIMDKTSGKVGKAIVMWIKLAIVGRNLHQNNYMALAIGSQKASLTH
uniref:Uncharacterized protein n=1 Tax=Vespula pensylvanica TaxID=30213 RepID=A0A834PF66_VESPE|nr:hypothetical protein H0235_001013 [Vespula pensylvanica]